MKITLKRTIVWAFIGFLVACGILLNNGDVAMAEGVGLTMTPMNQSVIIDPGDSRRVSFLVANPASASKDLRYELSVEPFYISENGEIYYGAKDNSGDMVDWVTFDIPVVGEIAPNSSMTIPFTVNVPESAPAGGQYVAIILTIKNDEENAVDGMVNDVDAGINIKEVKRMAHLVYAEITGDTRRGGEIAEVSVPNLLFSGNITVSSTVKNTGNVHGTAKYTLQIYPLFSDEEVFSNVENPDTKKVLPDRSVYRELVWDKTPEIGIFNVIYTVEFEGSVAEISRMVIVCPLWLLFVIFFVIAALIIWIVMRIKANNKRKAES